MSTIDITWGVIVLTVDKVAVELETGIVEDKVNSSSTLILENFHGFPQQRQVVVKNVLLSPRQLFTTRSLQPLDLLLGHVDEQG